MLFKQFSHLTTDDADRILTSLVWQTGKVWQSHFERPLIGTKPLHRNTYRFYETKDPLQIDGYSFHSMESYKSAAHANVKPFRKEAEEIMFDFLWYSAEKQHAVANIHVAKKNTVLADYYMERASFFGDIYYDIIRHSK